MHFSFTVRRVFVGFLFLGVSLAAFRRIPYLEIGLAIGAVVGIAFFVLALVAKKSDVRIIVRAYALGAIGALVGGMFGPGTARFHPPVAPVFIGAIAGWLVAAVIAESNAAGHRDTGDSSSARGTRRPPASDGKNDA